MSLFTVENAAEYARRSVETRRKRQQELKERAAMMPADADESARQRTVMLQIQQADDLIRKANCDTFPALTAAKERLWNLIFPKAGVRKPGKSQDRRPSPTAPIG